MYKRFSRNAAVLILALIIVIAPVLTLYVHAADGEALADTIRAYGLEASVSGSTVTVTGSFKNPAAPLVLNIGENVTVVWEAKLSGDFVDLAGGNLIILDGDGIFRMEDGEICAEGSGFLTAINSGAGNVDIIISDGTVSATSSDQCFAIHSGPGGSVTVSGGTVQVNGGNNSAALYPNGNNVKVTDGKVLALGDTGNFPFFTYFPVNVSVTGGFVFGHGSNIIHSTITLTNNGGTVVAWDKSIPPGPFGPFTAGDKTGLTACPADSAVWGRQDRKGGIVYDTDKFYLIPNVVVMAVPTAPQDFTAAPGDGQVKLSWDIPWDDGDNQIIRYEVSKDDGINWEKASSDTGYTFTGLTNGTPYTFKVRAVNGIGAGAEAAATATPDASGINAPPTITIVSLPNGTAGVAYSQQLSATGTAPITWKLEGGSLPLGLSISSDGAITGTPIESGTSDFSVKAENSAGSDIRALRIDVSGGDNGDGDNDSDNNGSGNSGDGDNDSDNNGSGNSGDGDNDSDNNGGDNGSGNNGDGDNDSGNNGGGDDDGGNKIGGNNDSGNNSGGGTISTPRTSASPKTRDDAILLGWYIALAGAVLGVLCALIWRRRQQIKGTLR